MRSALIVLILCAFHQVFSQGWLPVGARSNSMANSTVALKEDAWSYHHNPGSVATLKSFSAGVYYENRFLLRELQTQGLVIAQPLKKGVISFGTQLFGFQQYRSYRAGLGYALQLSEKFYAGVQLNYQGLKLSENYGSKNTLTAELGFLTFLTEKWTLGFSVFNLGRAKLADFQDDRFSTFMRLGTAYYLSDKVVITAEAEKDLDHPLRAKAGLEYQAVKNFYFRAGFATEPVEFCFGFGYALSAFRLDLGSAYHQQLGWSPHFSLTYQVRKTQ